MFLLILLNSAYMQIDCLLEGYHPFMMRAFRTSPANQPQDLPALACLPTWALLWVLLVATCKPDPGLCTLRQKLHGFWQTGESLNYPIARQNPYGRVNKLIRETQLCPVKCTGWHS